MEESSNRDAELRRGLTARPHMGGKHSYGGDAGQMYAL